MNGRRYFAEFGAGIALYAGLLIGSITVLRHGAYSPALRAAIALVPMLGGLAIAWAIIRQLQRLDEMQRKLQFDALCLAFLGTALITFSYGFLEGAGFPRLSMFVVWPLMAALWGAGSLVSAWRQRV